MDSKTIAFVFPGQGSQTLGMGCELAKTFPQAMDIFQSADDWLGFPLTKIAWDGPKADLDDTINTQPALLAHSVAALRVLQEIAPSTTPAFVAGHSMGEISALVACGALSYPEALKLARRRGELMKSAGERSPGGMAAILALDIPTVENICEQASSEDQIVQVANDNCPGQVVISGTQEALERAMQLARDAGARRVQPLAVSIAAHSPLMRHAQNDFNQAVKDAPIDDPHTPMIGNVTAQPLTSTDAIRTDLRAQLNSRVRWTESIQYMIQQNVSLFLELGSGSVLTGLLKRIDRNLKGFSLGAPADFEKFLSQDI